MNKRTGRDNWMTERRSALALIKIECQLSLQVKTIKKSDFKLLPTRMLKRSLKIIILRFPIKTNLITTFAK